MAQKVIPLFSDRARGSNNKMSEAKAVADKAREKLNVVWKPLPTIKVI